MWNPFRGRRPRTPSTRGPVPAWWTALPPSLADECNTGLFHSRNPLGLLLPKDHRGRHLSIFECVKAHRPGSLLACREIISAARLHDLGIPLFFEHGLHLVLNILTCSSYSGSTIWDRPTIEVLPNLVFERMIRRRPFGGHRRTPRRCLTIPRVRRLFHSVIHDCRLYLPNQSAIRQVRLHPFQ
jgi:hypothetical protein